MSGLIAWIIGCAITGALIGFIWGKVSKARKRKKMFAVESTPGTGYTPKQPNALTHPELSKLVKGKDKITWCGKEYWYYDVVDNFVWLIDPEKHPKHPGWQMNARVKADDIEALLQANKREATIKPIKEAADKLFTDAKELVKDVKEFREWKLKKANLAYPKGDSLADFDKGAKALMKEYNGIKRKGKK